MQNTRDRHRPPVRLNNRRSVTHAQWQVLVVLKHREQALTVHEVSDALTASGNNTPANAVSMVMGILERAGYVMREGDNKWKTTDAGDRLSRA